jgi:hypothetical protein
VSDAKTTRGNARGKPFEAGNPGRPKGSANKVNQEFRETVRKLLEDNAENVAIWLQQVASGEATGRPDPAKALDLLAGLAEYAAPKLSRTEHVGDGGGPVRIIATSHDENL